MIETRRSRMLLPILVGQLAFAGAVLATPRSSYAHDARVVHRGVTEIAVQNVSTRHGATEISNEVGAYAPAMSDGSENEDYGGFSFLHHAYNPYTRMGWQGVWSETALDFGGDRFLAAVSQYGRGSKYTAYDELGRALHLLQDVGTPAHAHGASHLSGDDYEAYEWHDGSRTGAWPAYRAANGDYLNTVHSTRGDSLGMFYHGLAKQTYDQSSWVKYGSGGTLYYENVDDPSLRLGGADRRHEWESESGTFYVYDLDDAEGRRVSDSYMHTFIPQNVSYSAGMIEEFWERTHGGAPGDPGDPDPDGDPFDKPPHDPDAPGPGNDRPDDNVSVSTAASSIETSPNDLSPFVRVAIKKNGAGVLAYQILLDRYQKLYALVGNEGTVTPETSGAAAALDAEIGQLSDQIAAHAEQNKKDLFAAPDVAVLNRGFAAGFAALLNDATEPVTFVGENFSPEIVSSQPVLVIPSGGLFGLDKSEIFKTKLEAYVKTGGTLIVFDQQHGEEYRALPGGEVDGAGWREAISCVWKNAEIDSFNPALSGMSDVIAQTSQDGYFTEYPENASVLLRGTTRAEGQPVLLTYPYGSGRVVATTLYTDWAYGMYSAMRTETDLVRNLVRWAKTSSNIPDYGRGTGVVLSERVRNISGQDAKAVKLSLLHSEGHEVASQIQNVALANGEEATVTFSGAAPQSLGIVSVDYTLLDDAGRVVQPLAEGAKFAVSRFRPRPGGFVTRGATIASSIDIAEPRIAIGGDAVFTVHVYNSAQTEESITAAYDGRETQLIVPPEGEESFGYVMHEVPSQGSLFVTFIDSTGQHVASASRQYCVFSPRAAVSAPAVSGATQPGGVASIETTASNAVDETYTATMRLSVRGPDSVESSRASVEVTMLPQGTAHQRWDYQLDASNPAGTYLVTADVFQGTKKIGTNATSFEVAGPKLSVAPQLPRAFSSATPISYEITNVGMADCSGAVLNVALKDKDGNDVWADTAQFDLAAHEATTVPFQVLVPEVVLGDYRLTYRLSYGDRSQSSAVVLPASLGLAPVFDKPLYRVGDVVGANVEILNDGRFDLIMGGFGFTLEGGGVVTMMAMGAGPSQAATGEPFVLGAGETTVIARSVDVPGGLIAGQQWIDVEATVGASSINRSWPIAIQQSRLAIDVLDSQRAAGEPVGILLQNDGGVDTFASYTVRLIDAEGRTIESAMNSMWVLAGGAQSIGVTVPQQAASGEYRVVVEAADVATGDVARANAPLQVSGIEGNVEAATEWPDYMVSEGKNIVATVTATNGAISGGTLNLKVLMTDPSATPSATAAVPLGVPIWEQDIPVDTAGQATYSIPVDTLPISGKLFVAATLLTQNSQNVACSLSSFYSSDALVGLRFDTDRRAYRPGETIAIAGQLVNYSGEELTDIPLTVYAGDMLIHEETVTLAAYEERPFGFTTASQESFTLRGVAADSDVLDWIQVTSPTAELQLDVPAVAGREPFEIAATLRNTGPHDADLLVDLAGNQQQIVLPARETKVLTGSTQIAGDTTVAASTSGDCTLSAEAAVSFGEDAAVTVDASRTYASGDAVVIPYSIHNTGQFATEFAASFDVSGTPFTRPTYLLPGETVEDTLEAGRLAPGTYPLTYSTPFEQGATTVTVMPREQVEVTGTVSMEHMPSPEGTTLAARVHVDVANSGIDSFAGELRVDGGFDREQMPMQMASGETSTCEFVLDCRAAEPGEHELRISLLDGNGREATATTRLIEIGQPAFNATSSADEFTFEAGEVAVLPFTITNTGDKEGMATLDLDLAGIDQQTESVWIAPGETSQVEFSVQIPTDIPRGDYQATYRIQGGQEQRLKIHVEGLAVTATASLNAELYDVGDAAVVTIDVSQLSGPPGRTAYVKGQLGPETREESFELSGQQTVTLELPVSEGEERMEYGVYLDTGRALYLNSLYVRQRGPVITLVPDKQVYQPGETVDVAVYSSRTDTLTVTAPGCFEDIAVAGDTSFSFTLPDPLRSGTQPIEYRFGETSGSVPIDISGYSVRVTAAGLDAQTYQPTDTARLSLELESAQAVETTVKAWVRQASGRYEEAFAVERDLEAGLNALEVTGSVEATASGTHTLVYGIYKRDSTLLLASGQEHFDVAGATLVSLNTSKPEYDEGEQTVADAAVAGQGTATLRLYLDGALVDERTLEPQGYGKMSIPLDSAPVGTHKLRACLVSEGVTAEREASFQVIQTATQPPVDITPPTISITSPSLTEYIYGQPLAVGFGATDLESEVTTLQATLNGDVVSDGATITCTRLGENTLTVTAVNAAGLSDFKTVTFNVRCDFQWLRPVHQVEGTSAGECTITAGSTLSLRWRLLDYLGRPVSGLTPTVIVEGERTVTFHAGHGCRHIHWRPRRKMYVLRVDTDDYRWMRSGNTLQVKVLAGNPGSEARWQQGSAVVALTARRHCH